SPHDSSLLFPLFVLFLMLPPPPSSTLFPYTTLFRSPPRALHVRLHRGHDRAARRARPRRRLHREAVQPGRTRAQGPRDPGCAGEDRKSTRLNSSHVKISYAVFCLKKKKKIKTTTSQR